MRALGPLWAFVITLDGHLLLAVTAANLGFAICASLLFFRNRRALDLLFITLGVFFVVMVVSLAGLHAFAGTPVREAQVFILD
ncbi:MAG: hypothetical protein KC620_13890 [Myxococcales bacterium]|nr:hypothetical protein [Myxococcales bacterium]